MIPTIFIPDDLDDEIERLAHELESDELKSKTMEFCHQSWQTQFRELQKICVWFGPNGPWVTALGEPLTRLGNSELLEELAALDKRILGNASGSRKSFWIKRPEDIVPYLLLSDQSELG